MLNVKICGMRRDEDIEMINRAMPDYAGFILSQGFGRTLLKQDFLRLRDKLDANIKSVGVFVNEPIDNILKCYADRLDVIQLHGNENAGYINSLREKCGCEIWKAARVRTASDIEKACMLPCDKLLIDSYVEGAAGGTGKRVNLDIILNANITKPYFLAGGISAENVAEAVRTVKPCGVDFSSSVETDGFKDEQKIIEIMEIINKLRLG